MRHVIVSIYDLKARAYAKPFFAPNEDMAIRWFGAVCSDPETELYKFPGDMSLFCVGFFDDTTALITPVIPPNELSKAVDFVLVGTKE